MITSHGFIAFVGAIAGFYIGVFWIDASASLELSQTKNEVVQLQKKLATTNKSIEQLKTNNTKREKLVKEFSKTYEATK